MARFSLPCHPWQFISVYRVHNSTVSKQLRYSLSQESVHHPDSSDEAPYVVVECMAINLSRTLSAIEQDKATSDDYVKCILADPQIAAYIVQAVVEEFKDMEIDEIIPCMGEPTVTLKFPERLGVKVQNTGSESVDEEDGKLFTTSSFRCIIRERKKNLSSTLRRKRAVKNQSLGISLKIG